MKEILIQKAKECKSSDELLALAKYNGIEMTADEAAAKFAALTGNGELEDDELDSVAGGSCNTDWVKDNTHVILLGDRCCPSCGSKTCTYITQRFTEVDNKQYFLCDGCGTEFYLTSVSTVNGKDVQRT